MKQLYIIRHGKASQQMMPDIKRPLIEKGIKRTRKFAKKLKETGEQPDLIISSPAVRAYQTAEILADIFAYPKDKIDINKYFYFHSEDAVLHQLMGLPDTVNTVFITGHNPIWTDLADELMQQDIWHLRTSGIAGVAFETDSWTDLLQAKRKDLVLIN